MYDDDDDDDDEKADEPKDEDTKKDVKVAVIEDVSGTSNRGGASDAAESSDRQSCRGDLPVGAGGFAWTH